MVGLSKGGVSCLGIRSSAHTGGAENRRAVGKQGQADRGPHLGVLEVNVIVLEVSIGVAGRDTVLGKVAAAVVLQLELDADDDGHLPAGSPTATLDKKSFSQLCNFTAGSGAFSTGNLNHDSPEGAGLRHGVPGEEIDVGFLGDLLLGKAILNSGHQKQRRQPRMQAR